MTWLLIGTTTLAAAAFLGLLAVWRERRKLERGEAERRGRLEERLSRSEALRFEAERRVEEAEASLRAVREAAGLEGARPVPQLQLEDLQRSGSLVAACLAGEDGLPVAGAGPLDAVESLAAFAGAASGWLPPGVTLIARDELGAELAARAVHIGGDRRVLVAESRGPVSLSAFERVALRLDPNPSPSPSPGSTLPALDARATVLLRGTSAVAALVMPERAGAFTDEAAATRLFAASDVLERAMDWLHAYDVMRASSVQLRDGRGTSALLDAGSSRCAVAIPAEGLDVLTEQRLAGLARRRLPSTLAEEGRAA